MHKLSVSIVAGALAAWVSTAATAQTKWDMPTPYPDGNFHTKNIAQFAEDIQKATDGKLTITVHSNGSLVKHPEIKNALRRGIAPIGEFLVSLHANESPIYGVDSVPFLATGYDAAKKLYEAQRPYLEKKLDEEGLMLLYSVPWPPQGIYAKTEIKTIDDLKGLRFRTYNVATQRVANLAGAIPTQVEVPDIPTAFATNRVEAMITSPSTGVEAKVWDYLTHFHDTQAWLPRNAVVVSKAAFEKLSDDERSAVTEAAKKAEARGWEMSAAETEEKIKALAANRITIVEPSPELETGFGEIGEKMADEWQQSAGEDGKALLDAYRQ